MSENHQLLLEELEKLKTIYSGLELLWKSQMKQEFKNQERYEKAGYKPSEFTDSIRKEVSERISEIVEILKKDK